MGRIPDYILEQIKDRVPLSDVISDYVTLRSKGGQLWGLCPFHDEKSPSFTVHDDKGYYHCFGCGKGGSHFNFLMDIEHITFIEAVQKLADRAGVELQDETPEMREKRSDKQAMYELYNRLASSFHYILNHKDEAAHTRGYLSSRKISKETIKDYQLGYAPADPDWLYRFLKGKKYEEEFLAKCGIFSRNNPRYPIFRDRLMFPIRDQSGNVIAFGGRALDAGNSAKYLNSPETLIYHKREALFSLHQSLPGIKKEDSFIICEGYFDVMALYEAGITNCVAPLGTAFTEEQAKRLNRYASRGILLFDSDHAGVQATLKAITILESLGIESEVITIEDKDPAEILQNSDIGLLKNIRKKSINSFTYMINKAKDTYDIRTPNGKLSVFNEVRPYLEAVTSEIKLSSSIKTLAEIIDVDERTILQDLSKQSGPRIDQQDSRGRSAVQGDQGAVSNELYLMMVIIHNREYYHEVRRQLKISDFEDWRAADIYTALEEAFREGETSFENLVLRIEHDAVRDYVLEHYGSDQYVTNAQNIIGDMLKRFRIVKLEQKRKSVISRIRVEERSEHADIQVLQDLLYEKKFIDEEIGRIRNS